MRCVILVCLLAASASALDCEHPNFFTHILCNVGDVAKTVGGHLKDNLQDIAIKATTTLGGSLISGLQHLASATSQSKRSNFAVDEVHKLLGKHQGLVDDLVGVAQNVTHVTLSKLDGLLHKFLQNPTEELLTKIMAHIHAHNVIQDNLGKFVKDHGAGLVTLGLTDVLDKLPHLKRDGNLLDQINGVGNSLAGGFKPIVSTLKGLVTGLGDKLLGFFKGLLPNVSQLSDAFKGHISAMKEHGAHLVDNAHSALDAVKDAVSDIWNETASQSKPHVGGILSHLGSLFGGHSSKTTKSPY